MKQIFEVKCMFFGNIFEILECNTEYTSCSQKLCRALHSPSVGKQCKPVLRETVLSSKHVGVVFPVLAELAGIDPSGMHLSWALHPSQCAWLLFLLYLWKPPKDNTNNTHFTAAEMSWVPSGSCDSRHVLPRKSEKPKLLSKPLSPARFGFWCLWNEEYRSIFNTAL